MRASASCALLASVLLAAECSALRLGPGANVNAWAHGLIQKAKAWNSENDYAENDYAENDYAENDYAENDYAETDYAETDYAETDYADVPGAIKPVRKHEEPKYTLLVKYLVRPSLAKEFSEQQLKVRDEAKKQKGYKMYTLSKPLTDNVLFYTYEEWESKKDFFEYLTSNSTKEVKKLAKYIEEKDIGLTLSQLIPFAAHAGHRGPRGHHGPRGHRGHRGPRGHRSPRGLKHRRHARVPCKAKVDASLRVMMRMVADAAQPVEAVQQVEASSAESVAAAEQRGSDGEQLGKHTPRGLKDTIVLTKFVVKPSHAFRFVHAAERFADASSEEKGNLAYGFSKPLTDDYTFYSYSVYESTGSAKAHLTTPHSKDFLRFVLENDVLTTTTVLLPVEKLA